MLYIAMPDRKMRCRSISQGLLPVIYPSSLGESPPRNAPAGPPGRGCQPGAILLRLTEGQRGGGATSANAAPATWPGEVRRH